MGRALVTGGAGFIGSHVVDALVRAGDRVLVVDDLSSGRESNLAESLGEGVELEACDIREADRLARLSESFAPDRIFHLAAQVDVRKAVADPSHDAAVNVLGTISALQAARAAGVGAFVFASTGGAIYGEGAHRELPFGESAEPAPGSGYAVSKLAAEHYVDLYHRLHGVPGVSLRFGNVYGPRQDPHGEAGVVAIFAGRARDGVAPTIFGDGSQTRDYVFVGDVVDAVLRAGDRLGEGSLRRCYNVGTGVETSVLELAEQIGRIAGTAATPEYAPPRAGEVERVAIDPAAIGEDLGWRPQTDLQGGLERTYRWVAGGVGEPTA